MTRNNSSTLEPFDLEIERTFRRLRNLVEEKVSPKKERLTMEETRVLGLQILQVLEWKKHESLGYKYCRCW